MNEEDLAQHARRLCDRHSKKIAEMVGAEEVPDITIQVVPGARYPASTEGLRMTLNMKHFSEREDDGAIIHELVHAIMNAPIYNDFNAWLIEGIADYVRDRLGLQKEWSREHYEKGKARAGYQTSAHFLMHLEKIYPGAVRFLSKELMAGTYSEDSLRRFCDRSLDDLSREYEAECEDR